MNVLRNVDKSNVKVIYELPLQKNLPARWEWKTLGEVADINPRIDKSTISDSAAVSFVPMPAVGAGDGRIDVSQLRPAKEVKKGYSPFQEGDVLFAKITPCMENGKMAVVPKVSNGYGFGSTEFHVLRPKQEMDARYLYYFISSASFRRDAARSMTGAVGQQRVPALYLSQCSIPLAPPDQQKLIVAEIEKQFSRLDEAIAGLKRVKANLKRYKAAVLKAAVEGKLTEEWRNAHPNVESGAELLKRILSERKKKWEERNPDKKYKEPVAPDTSNLPELPEGWVWASLDSICHQIGDVDHKMPKAKNEGIPYISTKDFLPAGGIDYANAKRIDQTDYEKLCRKIFPEKGDILLSRYGTVGEIRLVTSKILFQASYSIAILKPFAEEISHYVSLVLQTEPIQRAIKKHTRATAQPDLGLSHIRLLLLPLSPAEEQGKVIEEVDRLLSVAEELESQVDANLKRSERLRHTILRKAFAGELF